MSYSATGSYDGLGKVFTSIFKTPWGEEKFSVDVPVEKFATETLDFVKGKAMEALPPLLNMAKAEAVKMLPTVLDSALKQGGGYVTSTLWPQMAPKIRAEADRAIDKATLRGAIVAGGLLTVIVASAAWVRTKK